MLDRRKQTETLLVCAERSPEHERKRFIIEHRYVRKDAGAVLGLYNVCSSHLSADPIVHDVRMRRGLHERDGVKDVVYVVAEVENGIGYDRLGGGDASRQQRERRRQRKRRLKLLYCGLLQSKKGRCYLFIFFLTTVLH